MSIFYLTNIECTGGDWCSSSFISNRKYAKRGIDDRGIYSEPPNCRKTHTEVF